MDVSDWMTGSVTIAQAMGVSNYGEPTFAVGIAIPARVQPKVQMVRKSKDGSEALSSHTVYTTTAVGIDDRVTLPGETYPRLPLAVFTEVEKAGNVSFYKVLL